ncbi:plasmid mobilization relaxosome protein MobC [Streptomyces sp. B6B3]|uniref:plasmid mobilization relaxosome protein MobC n=1 Tax=Streptomyces sp. B6B3 TaxID=3153570 RepID=UPI00325E8C14
MTAERPERSTQRPAPDPGRASGGASCRLRRSYGPSQAPAQGSGGDSAGSRPRAHGSQTLGERNRADEATPHQPPTPSDAPFANRKPRRRARNPTQRPHKLTTRFSDAERTEITDAAGKRAVTLARFIADAALAASRRGLTVYVDERLDAAIDELVALRVQVSRVGNNINQIAYVYNCGGQVRPVVLDHAIAALTRTLAHVDDAADALATRRRR